MMLTPEHRRSTRTRKAPMRLVNKTKPKSKSKRIESNYKDFDYEDVYGECPIAPVGFEYDREHYLASSKYAACIDDEIAKTAIKSILPRPYYFNHRLLATYRSYRFAATTTTQNN